MKRARLFNIINSHPALILFTGILFTSCIIVSYNKFIRPIFKRQKYEEAQGYAEGLFQEELKHKANKSKS